MKLNTMPSIKLLLVVGFFSFTPYLLCGQNSSKIELADSLKKVGNDLRNKLKDYERSDSVLQIAKAIYKKDSLWLDWFTCVSRINSNAVKQNRGEIIYDSLLHYRTLIPDSEPYVLAKLFSKLGNNQLDDSRHQNAINFFKQEDDIYSQLRKEGFTDSRFTTYSVNNKDNLASCYSMLQDHTSALKYSTEAIQLVSETDSSKLRKFLTKSGIYNLYEGKYNLARFQFDRCLDLGGSPSILFPLIGKTYLFQDSLSRAAEFLFDTNYENSSESYYESVALYYEKKGDFELAIFNQKKRMDLLLKKATTNKRDSIKEKIRYAQLLDQNGSISKAMEAVQDVLNIEYPSLNKEDIYIRPPDVQSFPDIWVIEALYLKAQYFTDKFNLGARKRDLAESKFYYDLLLSHLDKLKLSYNSISAQYDMGSFSQTIYADVIDFYTSLYLETNNPEYFANALTLSQGANAFVLRNAIGIRKGLEASNVPRDRIDAFLELAAKASSSDVLPPNQENPIIVFDRYNQQLAKDFPSYKKYQEDQSLTIDAIRTSIGEKSILIKYYYHNNKITRFGITKEDVLIDQIVIDSTMRELMNTNQKMSSNTQSFEESEYAINSKRIYEIVIKDVVENPKFLGKDHLYIIPDGPLKSLSFSSLVTKNVSGPLKVEDYLLDKYSISYLYFCGQLSKRDDTKDFTGRFVGFGLEYNDIFLEEIVEKHMTDLGIEAGNNRSFSLKKLQFADDETNEIASIFNGKAIVNASATLGAVLENIKEYSIVHFSAHSLLNLDDYMQSSIILNKDKDQNYRLKYQDILNLNLSSDLVVLSACETGIGKSITGEGAVSLSRAFMQSGCKSTVGAYWEVLDESTKKVMNLFYSNLNDGMEKSKALQAAQVAYLSSSNISSPRSRSPLHWASWTVYGNDDPLPDQSKWHWYLLSLLGVIVMGHFAKTKMAA